MYKITFDETNNTEQKILMDLTFEELIARCPSANANEFTMRIKVLSKRINEIEDKDNHPNFEIIVDYVTVPKGKHKSKKTRPSFPDGRLIWEQISDEEEAEYLVKLTRSSDPKKPYFDWTEITPITTEDNEDQLIEALTAEPNPVKAAANDPVNTPDDDEESVSTIESEVAATG